MDIFYRVLFAVNVVGLLFFLLIFLDRKIKRIQHEGWQLFWRSLLFALVLTPTAYHHAPNTIVAPFHLSTICGNLFYNYDYTVSMFVFGVVMPVTVGWLVMGLSMKIILGRSMGQMERRFKE